MGYGPPLLTPIPAVQNTIATINIPKFHTCVQEVDLVTLNDTDHEGLHAPLLLNFF